jgi:hypothetical protein
VPKGAAPWPLETIGVTVGICALQADVHGGEIAAAEEGRSRCRITMLTMMMWELHPVERLSALTMTVL